MQNTTQNTFTPVSINANDISVAGGPTSFFGTALEPALLDICKPHLSSPSWFRTDWQRGGALTGFADYTTDRNTFPAVVKLPVPPQELTWLQRLQTKNHDLPQIVPDLYASDRQLGGYDFAWVVMQKLNHGPLDSHWNHNEFQLLADAAARFYAAAQQHPVDLPPRNEDWNDVLKRSRDALRKQQLPEAQRWSVALKTLNKKFKSLLETWNNRDTNHWCHGDLHFGNAMTLNPPPDGPAMLFDFAMVHAGHWVEDAVYFEHLYWPNPKRLDGVKPVKLIAAARKELNLHVDSDYPKLANIRRILLASAAPAEHIKRPNPTKLHAALQTLEKHLNT